MTVATKSGAWILYRSGIGWSSTHEVTWWTGATKHRVWIRGPWRLTRKGAAKAARRLTHSLTAAGEVPWT